MLIREFLDALRSTQGQHTLATVLEGPESGVRLLLCEGVPVWPARPEGLLARNLPALAGCGASGILTLENKRIFVEKFGGAPRLVICGGGHVAESVVRLAVMLGLPVTGLEERPEYADALRCAGAEKVFCGPYAENLTQVEGSAETYFVVATRAHSFDVECLTEIYKKRSAYVGMLGSRSRSALVRRQLIEAGTAPEKAEELHAPIGLAIKAQTAQEIALSILAEIVEVKNSRQQTEGFPPDLLNALDACTGQGKAPVLVTIVSRHGSTPREVGAKMLVLPDGRSVGSVGGGIMEYRVQQLASKMQAGEAAPCQLAEYSASAKEDDAALAACGGSMNVFLQLLKERKTMKRDDVILVRGGGDLATGTIHRLWSAGLKVLVLEAEHPAAIRRQVSVSEAVYEGGAVVEGMRATLVKTLDEAVVVWQRGDVPVMVDPRGEFIPQVRPAALVDAILAKKNLGTTRDMAPLTIALGPGFTAGVDVDFVVETKRGHRLGRIIWEGAAIPNTGVPGGCLGQSLPFFTSNIQAGNPRDTPAVRPTSRRTRCREPGASRYPSRGCG